jgi:hypothetical protein
MNTASRIAAVTILAALSLGGCATAQMSSKAAAMPMFAAEQGHPAIMQTLGPVRTYVCPGDKTDATVIDQALSNLRQNADAKGATALIDYRYRFVANSPRAAQCNRILEASAVAVMLSGA